MSYRCDDCGEVSIPGERCYVVPVETREHTFPYRRNANFVRVGREEFFRDDRGGTGTQIVREVKVCGECVSKYEMGTPLLDRGVGGEVDG